MSHFTVLVIGDNPEIQLAPYQENNMGDCPKEYLKFNSVEEEYREEWETGTRQEFYCESNSSWGMEITSETYDKIKDLAVGDTAIIPVTRGGSLSYFKKDKCYKIYPNYATSYPEKYHRWFKCEEILATNHPDSDVCFEGTIMLRKIDPPKRISLKEFYTKKYREENNLSENDGIYEELLFKYFIEEWAGYEERDPETGEYGYWENPNRKWDWYQIGGRWNGFFKLKEGVKYSSTKFVFETDGHGNIGITDTAQAIIGDSGCFGNRREDYTNRADQVELQYIDFEEMRKEDSDKAAKKYDSIVTMCNGIIPILSIKWEDAIDDDGPYKDMEWSERKEMYNNQESVKLWDEYRKNSDEDHFWDELEDFQCTKEEYMQRAADNAISTFAVVKDGKWYEKGKMGWWACVSNEKDQKEWNKEFASFIEDLPSDTLMTIVDCHI